VPNGKPKISETPTSPPSNIFGLKDDTITPLTRKGKGKERETHTPSKLSHSITMPSDTKSTKVAQKGKALDFAKKGLVVKTCFRLWQKKTTDKAAWLEAVQHGEAYRNRVRASNARTPTPRGDRKRTISSFGATNDPLNGSLNGSPPKKRARPRISSEYRPPLPDEELAKRFQEVCLLISVQSLI
jgi:hypothetical protein